MNNPPGLLLHRGSNVDLLADMATGRRYQLTNSAGHVVGEDHHRAKLTDHDVWLIHELRAEGVSCRQIAYKFDVSWHTVKSISAGRRRAQLPTGQRTNRRT